MDMFAQRTSAGKFTAESRTATESRVDFEAAKEVGNFWSVNGDDDDGYNNNSSFLFQQITMLIERFNSIVFDQNFPVDDGIGT